MNHFERFLLLGIFSFCLTSVAFAQSRIIITDDDLLDQTYTWSKENIYVLQKKVVLESGGKLTIEAGTTIEAEVGGGLVIQSGAQLFAEGTRAAPIIFTTEEAVPESWDALNGQKGKWRGVRIKGAPEFNSGVLTYVSIRQAGEKLNDLDEAGLVLENVDKLTTIHHLEVTASGLDGIKIKGGDVNLAYAAVALSADDGFDWEEGWQGNGLYWFAYQGGGDANPEFNGSYAIEGKGGLDQTQKSSPQIFNSTLIGFACAIDVGGAPNPNGDITENQGAPSGAIYLTEQTQGIIANSVFANFPETGIKVEDIVGNEDSKQAIESGELQIKNNLWWNFNGGDNTFQKDGNIICIDSTAEDMDGVFLTNHLEASQNTIAGPLINGAIRVCSNGNFKLDPRLTLEIENANYPSSTYPEDSFFTNLVDGNQKGAFVNDLWIQDWTMLDVFGEIGKIQLGTYSINGVAFSDIDTFKTYCGDETSLSVTFNYKLPICAGSFPGGGQGASTSRRGNKKRRTWRNPEGEDFAYFEEWSFVDLPNGNFGCLNQNFRDKKLVVIYVDTVAPIIHLTADENHLISAFVEDCDVANISEVTRDTLMNDAGELYVLHTFKAIDFSGNQSIRTVEESLKEPRAVWYPDLDGDGFGNSDLFIFSAEPVDGFSSKKECNDTNPNVQVEFTTDENGNLTCPGLVGDICRVATEFSPTMDGTASLINGTFSAFPSNLIGCGFPQFYQDKWMKIKVPATRNLALSINIEAPIAGGPLPPPNSCIDPLANPIMEIYQGDCDNLQFIECVETGRTNLMDLTPNDYVYIRVLEADNYDLVCVIIKAVELPATATIVNNSCMEAQSFELSTGDSCFQQTFINTNSTASNMAAGASCTIADGTKDIWFSYIATNNDSLIISIDTLWDSAFKTPHFELLKGESCDNAETLGCFEANARIGDLKAGDKLLIRVTEGNNLEGSFILNLCAKALVSTSVEIVEKTIGFQVSPNPVGTNQAMTLQLDLPETMPIVINVFDVQGQLVRTISKEQLGVGKSTITVPNKLLGKGIYLVQLQSETGIQTQKVIVL